MPTKSYPITGVSPLNTTLLELTVVFNPAACNPAIFVDEDRVVNITVVNGTLVEATPFNYIAGGGCTISIVDILADPTIIFWDATEAWVEGFEISEPHLYQYTRDITNIPLLPHYAPLHNFYDNNGTDLNDDRNYNSPFNTTALDLYETSVLDMKLQTAYDGSVNIIWTDDNNPMRIVNSRFKVNEDGTTADLIDRRARKDANTYSEVNFHQTELIPKAISIPTLTFNGLTSGGVLPGGGNRYFFRYVTADGAETDIIEESRLVSVHDGNTTLSAVGSTGIATTNAVSFSLSNLDQSFYGISVSYTVSVGEVDSISVAYRIDSPYIIENGGTCTFTHTGYENKTLLNIDSLSLTYSLISRSKTLDVVNNRLIVGNTDSLDVYDETLAAAAASIMITEGTFNILHSATMDQSTRLDKEENYSNPKFIYDNLGFWKGETYELGAVFITDDGNSPVYPLQGIDGSDPTIFGWDYNSIYVGGIYRGFVQYGQNSLGVYRTTNSEQFSDMWTYSAGKLTFKGTKLVVDVSTALASVATSIKGFFFVRRPRKKDVLVQGLLVPVAAIPIESKFGSEYELSGYGNYCGVGVTSEISKGNVKFVPAPMGIMPFGVEEVDKQVKVSTALLDSSGKQVTTKSIFSASKVTLSSVDGLEVGDTLIFIGHGTGTISVLSTAAVTVTIVWTAVPSPLPPVDTEVHISNSSSGVSTDFYIKAPIKDYAAIKSWALYSPDIECAPTYYASIFNSNKVGLYCTKQAFSTEQVNVTEGHSAPANINSILYHKITSDIDPTISLLGGDVSTFASYIDTGAVGVAPKGFSGSTDRNLYCYWGYTVGGTSLTSANVITKIQTRSTPFSAGNPVGKPLAYRAGNALAYGRYVGLKLNGYDGTSLSDLSSDESADVDKNINAYISLTNVGKLDGGYYEPQLGYVSSIYGSTSGRPIDIESWKTRYLGDEDTEYIAISPRYRIEDFFNGSTPLDGIGEISLYGGDCFLGLSWKQVYSPLGISEAPQSNDITAYKTTRRSLGLLSYGYAIPVPAQSNYNFNIRSKERVDEREYKVYGTDRSFLPLRGKDSIRGNRQYETGAYNHGYNAQDRSGYKQFRLNVNAPFYKFNYPNRAYASNQSSENEFVNAFTNFKGLNYKDYNSDLGAITKLMSLNNVLIAVFRDGVAKIGVDERSMVSQDTGGVFVDNANVLSRSDVKNSSYGSSHLHSVCASNNFVYGVDFTRLKVWRTNGEAFEIISDMKIQNKLGSISKELLGMMITASWIDIFSHFDSRKNELYFTFVVRNATTDPENNTKSRTIVYNETLELWVCETDDTRKFVFQSNEYRYAFPSVVNKYNKLYKYQIGNQASTDPTVEVFGEYNKFYDTIYDMSFDYHVIDEMGTYKIFNNVYIVGNNSLPKSITYTSDHNSLTEQELKPYTNIRYPMRDTNTNMLTVTGSSGTQILYLSGTPTQIEATQRDLGYGDFVSVIGADAHTTYRYVVIEYNAIQGYIRVDKELADNFNDKQLYYGYGSGYPLRLTDSAFEESYGVITCQFNNRTTNGISPAKLRGKWMRFSQLYEGTAPVYISGIITDYGLSLS